MSQPLPRKSMEPAEREFLRVAGTGLAEVKLGGAIALATMLDLIAAWHGSRAEIPFHDFGQRWLLEGNAKNRAADRLLRDIFGLGDPDPRRAA